MGYINILLMLGIVGIVALHSHGEGCMPTKSQKLPKPSGSISYSGDKRDAACDWKLPDTEGQGLIIQLLNTSLEIKQRNETFAAGYVILPGNVKITSSRNGRRFAYSPPNSTCGLSQLARKVDTSSPDTFTWMRLVDTMDHIKFRSTDSQLKSFQLNYTYVDCTSDIDTQILQPGGLKHQVVFIAIIGVLALIAIIVTALYIHQRVTTKRSTNRGDCRTIYTLATNDSDGASSSRQQEPMSEMTSHSYINPYEEIPAHEVPENYREVVPNSLYNRT